MNLDYVQSRLRGRQKLPCGRASISADELQPISLIQKLIELLLVAIRRHAMASDELGARSLFPNGGVKWSVTDLVAVHQDEAITLLADQLVEFLLIGLRG